MTSRRRSLDAELTSDDEFHSVADPLERPERTINTGPAQSNGAHELSNASIGHNAMSYTQFDDHMSLDPNDSISNAPALIDERDATDPEEEEPSSEDEEIHSDEDEEWRVLGSIPLKLRESKNLNEAKIILCANAVAFVVHSTRASNQRGRSKPIKYRKLLSGVLSLYAQWDDELETDTEEILPLPMFSICFLPGTASQHPNTVEGLTIVIESNRTSALILENDDHVACILPSSTDVPGQPVVLFTPEDSEGHARNHASFLQFASPVDAADALWRYFLSPGDSRPGNRRARDSRFVANKLTIIPPLPYDNHMAPIYQSNISLLSNTIKERNFVSDEAADRRSLVTMEKNIKVEETKAANSMQAREKLEVEIAELQKELDNVQKMTDTMFHEHARRVRTYPGSQAAAAAAAAAPGPAPLDPDQQRETASQSSNTKSGKKSSGFASIVKRPFQLLSGSSSSGSSTPSTSAAVGTPTPQQPRANKSKGRQRRPSWEDAGSTPQMQMQGGTPGGGYMDPSWQQAMQYQAGFDQDDPSIILARQLEEQDRAEAAAFQQLQRTEHGTQPFYCDIDSDWHPPGDKVMIEQCQHEMCRNCLLSHIKAQVSDARWPIYCPLCPPNGRGRRGVVSRWIAEIVGADEKIFENWVRMELSGLAIDVECPQCKKATPVDAEDFRATDRLDCRNCGAHWCKNCNRLTAQGATHSCDGEEEYKEHIAGNPNLYKRCPRCGTMIEKNLGLLCTTSGFILAKMDLFSALAARGAGQVLLDSLSQGRGPIGATFVSDFLLQHQQIFLTYTQATAVILSITATAPFKPGDSDLGVAYISIFILVFFVSLFPLGGHRMIANDFEGPDKEIEEVKEALKKRQNSQLYSLTKLLGFPLLQKRSSVRRPDVEQQGRDEPESILPHHTSEKEEEGVPNHSNTQEDTTGMEIAHSSKHARHISFGVMNPVDHFSVVASDNAPQHYVSSSRSVGRDAPDVMSPTPTVVIAATEKDFNKEKTPQETERVTTRTESITSSVPLAVTFKVLRFLRSIICPATIAMCLAFPIALVKPLKGLFVEVSDSSIPNAPDGKPPLYFILDTANFLGAASIPLGLICLGAALAKLKVPSTRKSLPIGAIASMAVGKLVVSPVLGVLIVNGFVKIGFIDEDDKVLRFFSGMPTATTQVFLTQVYSGTGEAEHLSAFLIPQYALMFISTTALTAYSLHTLF
ncbi:Protein M3 [Serendipita sp. 399]|nr:Protein M3 [Serendipita sp. 399]